MLGCLGIRTPVRAGSARFPAGILCPVFGIPKLEQFSPHWAGYLMQIALLYYTRHLLSVKAFLAFSDSLTTGTLEKSRVPLLFGEL